MYKVRRVTVLQKEDPRFLDPHTFQIQQSQEISLFLN